MNGLDRLVLFCAGACIGLAVALLLDPEPSSTAATESAEPGKE